MGMGKDAAASRRAGAVGRWWFTGVGVFFLTFTLAGFVPASWGLAQRGITHPVEIHVHAALMGLLLVAFIVQALLAGRGDVALHRRLGGFAAALGAAAAVSMPVALDSAMRRENPLELPHLPAVLTLGMLQSVAFLGLFVAALLTRKRPAWHRRLLAFALLTTLLAAIGRMSWLPDLPLPSYWARGGWLYVLALPLLVFDLTILRRLHAATWTGLGVVTLLVGLLATIWNDDAYRSFFQQAWLKFYGG